MPAMEYESEYGIEVLNRFAGLEIETEDPAELIERAQQKEKALKADKKQAKNVKGGSKTQERAQAAPARESNIESAKKEGPRTERPERQDRVERGGRGRGIRGGRGRGRGRGGQGSDRERPPRENRSEQKDNEHENQGEFDSKPSERKGFGGEKRVDRQFGSGEKRNFGDRRGTGGDRRGFGGRGFGGGFGNDNETSGERRSFGSGFSGDPSEQQDEGFGKRGGRGSFRPRGRARGRARGREFDRHSGSDRSTVKPIEKRDGFGSFNTGNPIDDQLNASEETLEQLDSENKVSWADAAEEADSPIQNADEQNEETPSSPKVEEAKEMTLDEYKSIREKEKPQTSFNVRQANEGEKTFPKNCVNLKKPSEEEREQDGSLFFPRRIIEEKIKTSGRIKEHLQVDLKYAATDSRLVSGANGGRGTRRGRGGRGRAGGRRGGFGGRGGGDGDERTGFGEKEVSMNDHYDNDFPSLLKDV